MTQEQVLEMVEEMGLPCSYDHFAAGQSPEPSFLVFLYLESRNFAADGVEYYVINNNMGYDGNLELAMIPETGSFALLFEFEGM